MHWTRGALRRKEVEVMLSTRIRRRKTGVFLDVGRSSWRGDARPTSAHSKDTQAIFELLQAWQRARRHVNGGHKYSVDGTENLQSCKWEWEKMPEANHDVHQFKPVWRCV